MKTKCITYKVNISDQGYGRISLNSKTYKAHRIVYKLFKGALSKHLEIDHLCRNRACINPEHLEQVTHKINVLRGESTNAKNARKTHCKRGHVLKGRNVYIVNKKGHRSCNTCKKAYSKNYYRNKIKNL